ncbi:hypothetical protein VULLAG_LOCUS8676 [Vulpes lagopus]
MPIRLRVGAGSYCGRGGGGRNHWSRPFSRSIKGNSSPVHLHPRIQNVSPLPSWSPDFSCPFPDLPQYQPP